MIHYFTTYKDIPGENTRRMEFVGLYGAETAWDVIHRSLEDYKDYLKNND